MQRAFRSPCEAAMNTRQAQACRQAPPQCGNRSCRRHFMARDVPLRSVLQANSKEAGPCVFGDARSALGGACDPCVFKTEKRRPLLQ